MRAKYAKLTGLALIIFLAFRFLLPLVLPFVLAYFFAKMVSPIIFFLENRLHWRHRVSVLFVVIIVFAALAFFFSYMISIAVSQTILLLQKLPVYQQMFSRTLESMCGQCDRVFELVGGTSLRYVEHQIENLYHTIGAQVLPRMSGYVTQIFRWVFTIASTVFIFVISTLLILFDDTFPKIRGKVRPFAGRLRRAGLAYIKSQGIIFFIIATVITVGLFLMGNDYAVIMGVGIAVFDAFPVVGSGAILIPWALIKIIGGNYYAAAVLITVFAIAAFLREVLEPKLFGKELGMKPLYILVSVYVGAELLGLAGVLLGPIGLTILKAAEEEMKKK